MFDHESNQLVVAEVSVRQAEFFVNRLTLAQQIAWLQLQLTNEFSELLLTQRLDVVIHLFKRNTTLPEQFVEFATFRSSGFFVNGDVVCHMLS